MFKKVVQDAAKILCVGVNDPHPVSKKVSYGSIIAPSTQQKEQTNDPVKKSSPFENIGNKYPPTITPSITDNILSRIKNLGNSGIISEEQMDNLLKNYNDLGTVEDLLASSMLKGAIEFQLGCECPQKYDDSCQAAATQMFLRSMGINISQELLHQQVGPTRSFSGLNEFLNKNLDLCGKEFARETFMLKSLRTSKPSDSLPMVVGAFTTDDENQTFEKHAIFVEKSDKQGYVQVYNPYPLGVGCKYLLTEKRLNEIATFVFYAKNNISH